MELTATAGREGAAGIGARADLACCGAPAAMRWVDGWRSALDARREVKAAKRAGLVSSEARSPRKSRPRRVIDGLWPT